MLLDFKSETTSASYTVDYGCAVRGRSQPDRYDGQHCLLETSVRVAAHFRGREVLIVLGGPPLTFIPTDSQPHADLTVVGYAEDTWPELLCDFV